MSPNETETLVSSCHVTPSVMSEDENLKSTQVANDKVSHPVENYARYSDIGES